MKSAWNLLITGSSGFLGQHIVREIQKSPLEGLGKIILLDKVPFKQKLTMPNTVPMSPVVADLAKDREALQCAMSDVDSIIHCAGIVSTGAVTDHTVDTFMEVNFDGTRNLLTAAVDANVKNFVFTSTVDVAIGKRDIVYGNERSCTVPKSLLFPGYPLSKLKAEHLVQKVSLKHKDFNSVILRPTVLFGECDPYLVRNAVNQAEKHHGTLQSLGGGGCLQVSYAGNVAWAHLKALEFIRQSHTSSKKRTHRLNGSQVFFVTDDTPVTNIFNFLEVFLANRNQKVSALKVPYQLIELISGSCSLIRKIPRFSGFASEIPPLHTLRYIARQKISFSDSKMRRLTGYKPIYSWQQSFSQTLDFID